MPYTVIDWLNEICRGDEQVRNMVLQPFLEDDMVIPSKHHDTGIDLMEPDKINDVPQFDQECIINGDKERGGQ